MEAEAVAYIVAARAELATASATYLCSYARDANLAEIDTDLVVRAAARIERLAQIHYGSMTFRWSEPRYWFIRSA
ncbi:MAG: hypothetical protein ACREF3_01285 [Acetobacteraceae bacterium]